MVQLFEQRPAILNSFPYSEVQITSELYYQGKVVLVPPDNKTGLRPVSCAGDTTLRLHHAWDMMKFHRQFGGEFAFPNATTIVITEHQKDYHWVSVKVNGEWVKADKEVFTITATEAQIELLASNGRKGPHKDWAPAFMLHDLIGMPEDDKSYLYNEYGIDLEILEFLRGRRNQGSWLDIIEVVALWRTEKDDSLGNYLTQYLR